MDSFFGIPRGIQTGGAALNILFANTVERNDGDKDARVQLRFQTGLISSALEHAVPEQMFSDPDNPTDGVSAVKALQLAAQEGQRIYQIDASNVNTVLSQISLDASVEDEIRTYVRNNRIAIAHSSNISVPGWTGAGYILLDQDTGIGSYKITGGGIGGFYIGFVIGLLLVTLFVATSGGTILAAIAASLAIGVFPSLVLLTALFDLDGGTTVTAKCFNLGLLAGLLMGLLLLSGLGGAGLIAGGGILNAWLSFIYGGNVLVDEPFSDFLDPSECIKRSEN